MEMFQRLLGASFDRLPADLRRFHAHRGGEAAFTFDVRRSPGVLRAAAARILGFPDPAEHAHGSLHVQVRGEREIWTRVFGRRAFTSEQWIERGRLIERAGPVRLVFEVIADEAGMRFAMRGCRFFGLPLPRPLAPEVGAVVRGNPGGWRVDVTFALPLLGAIATYDATVVCAA